jgi:threonine aldolase
MNFASDNTAGIAPEFLEALTRANEGFAMGYGNDALTQRAERCLAEFFGHEVAAFFVTTGTDRRMRRAGIFWRRSAAGRLAG